jgi:hypothetical protein
VQRFFFTARLNLETLAADCHLLALPQVVNHSGPKEEEIIAQRHDEGQPA